MADFKQCWLRTAHEHHGWTEVDGKVVSMVDASTVLKEPGARYHLCDGVRDIEAETKRAPRGTIDHYDRNETYRMSERIVGGITVRTERLVTLTGIYERIVREDTEWRLLQQLDCFCCSCDREGDDPACRNHGWAAKRPCETHGTPGLVWDDETGDGDIDGQMPESVQRYRARQKAVDSGTAD